MREAARGRARRPTSVSGRYASRMSTGSDGDAAREHLEQVARERVDPVAVLEHEHERLFGRSRAQAVGEQRLERRLAQLRRRSERVSSLSGIEMPSTRRASGARGRSDGIDALELALERARLLALRQLVVDAEERAPDLAARPGSCVRAEGLALAEGDEVRRGAWRVERTRRPAATCPCRPRRRPRSRNRCLRARGRSAPPGSASSARAPDDRQLVARAAPRRPRRDAGELENGDRRLLALDRQVGKPVPDEGRRPPGRGPPRRRTTLPRRRLST